MKALYARAAIKARYGGEQAGKCLLITIAATSAYVPVTTLKEENLPYIARKRLELVGEGSVEARQAYKAPARDAKRVAKARAPTGARSMSFRKGA